MISREQVKLDQCANNSSWWAFDTVTGLSGSGTTPECAVREYVRKLEEYLEMTICDVEGWLEEKAREFRKAEIKA